MAALWLTLIILADGIRQGLAKLIFYSVHSLLHFVIHHLAWSPSTGSLGRKISHRHYPSDTGGSLQNSIRSLSFNRTVINCSQVLVLLSSCDAILCFNLCQLFVTAFHSSFM